VTPPQAFELREHLAGQAQAMQDAVAQEKAAGGQRLHASEEQNMELRGEFRQHLVAAEGSITQKADELKRLALKVTEQEKAIREAQHNLDAHESTGPSFVKTADNIRDTHISTEQ